MSLWLSPGRGKPERQESQALLWYFRNFTQKFRLRTGQMSSRRGQTSNQPCELEALHCLSQLSRTPTNMGRYVASLNPYTSLPSKCNVSRTVSPSLRHTLELEVSARGPDSATPTQPVAVKFSFSEQWLLSPPPYLSLYILPDIDREVYLGVPVFSSRSCRGNASCQMSL